MKKDLEAGLSSTSILSPAYFHDAGDFVSLTGEREKECLGWRLLPCAGGSTSLYNTNAYSLKIDVRAS